MTDQEKKQREALRLEIRARKELIKRLDHPKQLLAAAAKKEKDRRVQRIENARQYKDERDAQDAYGWGFITEEEYDEIRKALEAGDEYIEKTTTPTEIAEGMLSDFLIRLSREVASFEFDLLPPSEQERIRRQNEEILKKRAERKGGANRDTIPE